MTTEITEILINDQWDPWKFTFMTNEISEVLINDSETSGPHLPDLPD